MRTDRSLAFEADAAEGILPGRRFQDGASQSGRERNHLFANLGGTRFRDVSAISGADSVADGRAFARFDYDRDGRPDLAVVNANAPLLQIFRNEAPDAADGGVVAIRLVGANAAAQPTRDRSPRDPVGARVTVRASGRTLVRELRAGEGFAAQNSATLLVGLDGAPEAQEVEVRWPSGRRQRVAHVAQGTLLTVNEGAGDPPGAKAVVRTPYSPARPAPARAPQEAGFVLLPDRPSSAGLRLVTTFATWCEACERELPRLAALRAALPSLDMLGLPADEAETPEQLRTFAAERRPPYRILFDATAAERERVRRWLETRLGHEVLPSSILVDARGRVRATRAGVPSLSEVRRLLAEGS